MFKNIGKKIMILAEVLCWVGIVASFVGGIALINDYHIYDSELYGFLVIILGSLLSWAGSFVLYGFGQLVENSCILVGKLQGKEHDNLNQ